MSGTGKTHLVAAFVAEEITSGSTVEYLWYDMPQDGTLEDLLALLPADLAPRKLAVEHKCKHLLGQLRLNNSILIIDNVERADTSTLDYLFDMAVRFGAPALVICITSEFRYLRQGDRFVIEGFDTEEASTVLARRGVQPSPSAVRQLVLETGGLGLAIELFATLVNVFDASPEDVLSSALASEPLIEQWFDSILQQLTVPEANLLTLLSLSDTGFDREVVDAATKTIVGVNKTTSFIKLQRLYLVSSVGIQGWKVHQFVASQMSGRTSPGEQEGMYSVLADVYLSRVPKAHPRAWDPLAFAQSLRACRYLQRAGRYSDSEQLLHHMSSPAKATGYYRTYLTLAMDQLEHVGEWDAWIYYHAAHCALILGRPADALSILRPALLQQLQPTQHLSLTRLQVESLREMGAGSKALRLLGPAIRKAELHGARRQAIDQAKAAQLGLVTSVGDLRKAESLARRLLGDAKRDRLPVSVAVAEIGLGRVLRLQGNGSSALKLLLSGNKRFRTLEDQRGISWSQQELANLFFLKGDEQKVAEYAREAVRIRAEIGENTQEYREFLTFLKSQDSMPADLRPLIAEELLRVSN